MKRLFSPWWAVLTIVVLLSAFSANITFLESIKLRYFDTLIVSKPVTQNNIYTVNIDEAALEQLGQWPLPRGEYARIVKELYDRGAGLVVLNVMMPDEDRSGQDHVLADAMEQFPLVLPSAPGEYTRNTPRNPGAAIINSDFSNLIVNYPGIVANIELLESRAAGVGIVNTMPEIDGVNRRLPLVVAVNGVLYPSLSLEVLRIAAGDPSFQIRLNELGVDRLRIPGFSIIPTDSLGRVWVDFSQQSHSVSLSDLPEDFYGAVVIVGPTAAGIANPVPTAGGAVFPQDLQAAVIGTMFNGVNIERPNWAEGAELLYFIAISILLIAVSRWMAAGMMLAGVGIVSSAAASYYLFYTHHFLVDAVMPTVGLLLVVLHVYGVKFAREFLEKQAIKKQFEGYASPAVVKILQENPALIKDGQKREISICFSDLRGFTPLGESFGDDVKGLTEVMNGYMDAITQPVLNNNGMIIKYIGDASMHIHGAPVEDPDHAYAAVKTGLEMLKAVEVFNQELTATGRPPVGMGAGINTGLGYLGEMGSKKRHSYDVLGDAVSTTARLESQCKNYGVLLIVGPETYRKTQTEFFYLKLDDLAVKGKTVGLDIYTVLDTNAGAMAEYILAQETHNEMHQLYRQQKFKAAAELCAELKGEFDGQMHKYYDMWIERCEYMSTQKLPKDWSGVFIAQSK
jgi:adenylate cyclase